AALSFSSGRRHTRFSRDWSSDVCSADLPGEPTIDRISIATGPASGAFHPVGTAMAEILDGRVAGLPATARATATAAESVRLVGSGDSEIAIAPADVVQLAIRGEGEFSDPTDLRVLMLLHPEVYHAVTLR